MQDERAVSSGLPGRPCSGNVMVLLADDALVAAPRSLFALSEGLRLFECRIVAARTIGKGDFYPVFRDGGAFVRPTMSRW